MIEYFLFKINKYSHCDHFWIKKTHQHMSHPLLWEKKWLSHALAAIMFTFH